MNPNPRPVAFPRPSRAARPLRRDRRVVLPCVAALAWWPLVAAAEEPLQLGNAQVGLTAEAMSGAGQAAANTAPPAPAGATETAPETAPSEWTNREATRDPWAPEESAVGVAPAVTSYDGCVELAVRAGNGFKAASGVCAVIFPEPVAPSQRSGGAAPVAPTQKTAAADDGTKVAAPPEDDGPVVLTLDGPVPKLDATGTAD